MDIKAFKMDGLGNDFVIIDNRQKITNLSKEQIIKICDREFIGCDQLILITKNDSSDASLEFTILMVELLEHVEMEQDALQTCYLKKTINH